MRLLVVEPGEAQRSWAVCALLLQDGENDGAGLHGTLALGEGERHPGALGVKLGQRAVQPPAGDWNYSRAPLIRWPMESIERLLAQGKVHGTFEPRFHGVAEAFAHNFTERGEVGATVAVTVGGATVVDLWGGLADERAQEPWQEDTLSVVYSCTKGMTALCAHMLASRGALDVDAPVAEYWPEFAEAGKSRATVRMLLDHSAGVPVFRQPLRSDGCVDWHYMADALARQEPFWEPGTRNGYHMLSFGWTVGEVVRRVAGRSLGQFFREEVAEPLNVDFFIGLPEGLESRVSRIRGHRSTAEELEAEFAQRVMNDSQSIQALSLLNTGGFDPNSRACHAAEIGGAGGIANARAMARIYAALACGGTLDGVKLVDSGQLPAMGEVSVATHRDATLLLPSRFSLGFMKSMDNRRRAFGDRDSVVLSGPAFGHVGAGGSIGFADPVEGMGFGYTMNKMGPGIMLNPRGQSLVDATYRALGYRSSERGFWSR